MLKTLPNDRCKKPDRRKLNSEIRSEKLKLIKRTRRFRKNLSL